MRKTILSIIAAASFITASAAVPTLTENWSKSLTGINVSPNYVTPVKTDATGAVIATGTFDTDFEFAKNTLEALGTSSYILKYAADGTPAWGVALTGAATISAVDTDTDGNVYVAGTFADEVVFNTTSGEPITETGVEAGGSYITDQNASFIAKYSADGKVESVETFVPQILNSIAEQKNDEVGPFYFSNPVFKINHIELSGDKIYASAVYSGSTTKDNVVFDGSYQFAFGFMFDDMSNAAIFSLSTSELNNCQIEAALTVNNPVEGDIKEGVESATFTISENKLYVAFVGKGSLTLENGSLRKELEFKTGLEIENESGYNEYGFIVCDDNNYYCISNINEGTEAQNKIASLAKKDGYVSAIGNFQGKLQGVTEEFKATGTSDLFVLSLDCIDMTLAGLNTFDDGGTSTYEVATDAAQYGDGLFVNYKVMNKGELNGAKSVIFDGTAFTEAPVAATGVSTADKAVAFGQVTAEGVTFSSYTSSVSGITDITTDGGVSVFPNPVVDVLNFSEPVDVIIYSLNGSVVKTASQVSTLNVTDLATGLYIVKAGDKAVRVIKK